MSPSGVWYGNSRPLRLPSPVPIITMSPSTVLSLLPTRSIFDARCESLVWPQQRHRRGRGKELGVAGGLEELALVERVDGLAVECGHHQRPSARARPAGCDDQRGNLLRQGELAAVVPKATGLDGFGLRRRTSRRLAHRRRARTRSPPLRYASLLHESFAAM